MKKKILCSLLFLTILFCISYSQTHPFTFRSSAEENADAESDISSEGTVSPGGQYTAEFSPDATPEPLENTAGSEGQYTLSLTSSIGTLTYYNQSDSRWADYLYGGSDPLSVYGCGPTVMAMIVNSFTEHTCQPPDRIFSIPASSERCHSSRRRWLSNGCFPVFSEETMDGSAQQLRYTSSVLLYGF